MYIFKLFKEIKIWLKIRKVAKENEKLLNENGFRVDWIGRIYTVINLPEEVVNAPISQEGYVLMRLREYDQIFLTMGIADYVSPEMEKIPNSDSFLLVISPNSEYVSFWPMVWFFVKLFGIYIGIKILIYIIKYLYPYFIWLSNLIF
jgi:hypothetical protein